MTQRKINARSIIVEVESATADTWLRVENLSSVTVNRAENEEAVDTTDFDSEGAYEQEILQRGASMALAGMELKDSATGALQPGRARVEACGAEDMLGTDSLNRYRFRHPMATEWRIWTATTSIGETGGETNAKSAWAATITKSGLSTTAAVS